MSEIAHLSLSPMSAGRKGASPSADILGQSLPALPANRQRLSPMARWLGAGFGVCESQAYGGDGSGKSTQMQRIEAYLTEMGQEVLLTREPGGTPMAEKIREMILDPANRDLTGRAEMLLYAAARAQHVEEKILPALRAGKTVLSDRFTDSSIAYQGFGRGLGDMVAEVNHIATGGVEPDLTIFLNITPAAGMARKNRQDGHVLDRLEQEKAAFHEAVYAGYLQLAKENSTRIADIDADRPVEAVFADIRKALDRVFGFAPQK